MSQSSSSVHVVFSADAEPSPRVCLEQAQRAGLPALATCEGCGDTCSLERVAVTDSGFLCVVCESERELEAVMQATVQRTVATGPVLVALSVLGGTALAVVLVLAGPRVYLMGGWSSVAAALALVTAGLVVASGGMAQLWRASRLSRSEIAVKASLRRMALASAVLSTLVGATWLAVGTVAAVLPVLWA